MANPQRELLFARSGGVCQCVGACALHTGQCATDITLETFHRSHLRSRHHGGSDHETNLEAWCSRCNLTLQSRDARDPRVLPREWQLRELDKIVGAITRTGAATLSAAPGAGKTIFASLVFEALQDADIAARMMVVVPRRGLAEQWMDALARSRHIQLKPHSAIERPGQHGVVVTYQSLPNRDQLRAHLLQTRDKPTLLVLDEVHHLARDADGVHRSWADAINELAGDVDSQIHVAGILNLSGTLWRSARAERISTVRYTPPDADGKIISLVDGSVTVEELIREGLLRSIDLYRLSSRVSVADYQELQFVEGNLADVDEKAARAAVARLGAIDSWRSAFVSSVLDKLEQAHRATSHHVKALIVASRQEHAIAFRNEVNQQMQRRGLQPLAALAISDEDDAQRTLENFRQRRQVGVLCTVDMAGEGYDCPDIAVLGYASNKLTPLYVRQVCARAMRVTARERELGATLPAIVVLPDAPALVEQFLAYMAPALHEIRIAAEPPQGPPPDSDESGTGAGPRLQRFVLTEAQAEVETVTVSFLDGTYENIDPNELAAAARELELVNMPEIYRPRALAFHRRTLGELLNRRPFDIAPKTVGATVVQANVEQRCEMLQKQIAEMERWWAVNGNSPVAHFATRVNQAGGIRPGRRSSASPEELEKALQFARQHVDAYQKGR